MELFSYILRLPSSLTTTPQYASMLTTIKYHSAPFVLHLLIELPAALSFFLFPELQTKSTQPLVHAVIRQYAALLVSVNLIAIIFAVRPKDRTTRLVAGSIALYHFAPLLRALGRILDGEDLFQAGLGGPVVHLIAHALCLGSLGWLFLLDSDQASEIGRKSD